MGGEIEGVDSPPVVSLVDDVAAMLVVVVVDDRGRVLAKPKPPTAIVLGVWSSSGLTQCDVVFSSSIIVHKQQKESGFKFTVDFFS